MFSQTFKNFFIKMIMQKRTAAFLAAITIVMFILGGLGSHFYVAKIIFAINILFFFVEGGTVFQLNSATLAGKMEIRLLPFNPYEMYLILFTQVFLNHINIISTILSGLILMEQSYDFLIVGFFFYIIALRHSLAWHLGYEVTLNTKMKWLSRVRALLVFLAVICSILLFTFTELGKVDSKNYALMLVSLLFVFYSVAAVLYSIRSTYFSERKYLKSFIFSPFRDIPLYGFTILLLFTFLI